VDGNSPAVAGQAFGYDPSDPACRTSYQGNIVVYFIHNTRM
jgi:hypothetical protein